MKVTEHILVDEEVKDFLKKNKKEERESFNFVLRRLLKLDKKCKEVQS